MARPGRRTASRSQALLLSRSASFSRRVCHTASPTGAITCPACALHLCTATTSPLSLRRASNSCALLRLLCLLFFFSRLAFAVPMSQSHFPTFPNPTPPPTTGKYRFAQCTSSTHLHREDSTRSQPAAGSLGCSCDRVSLCLGEGGSGCRASLRWKGVGLMGRYGFGD